MKTVLTCLLIVFFMAPSFAQKPPGMPPVGKSPHPREANRTVKNSVKVKVGDCTKPGMKIIQGGPKNAIIEEQRRFDSYDQAMNFAQVGYQEKSKVLELKYCESGKKMIKENGTAICGGSTLGSHGVMGDDRSTGFYRIYGFSCDYKIDCDLPSADGMGIGEYKRAVSKAMDKCISNFKEENSTDSEGFKNPSSNSAE